MKIINKSKFVASTIITCGIVGIITIVGVKVYSNATVRNSVNLKENVEVEKKDEVKVDPEQKLKDDAQKKYDKVAENAIKAEEVLEMLNGTYEEKLEDGQEAEKIVFLTFDDGPSTTNTPEILDILDKYNIKATFFMLGENIDKNDQTKELVKKIYDTGHAIANHSYSHDMRKLYPGKKVDVDTFINEVEQTNESLKNVLGKYFNTRVLRMPGGYMTRKFYNDPNLSVLDKVFSEKGIISIDWNALNKDAEGRVKNSNQLLNEVVKTSQGKDKVILLMHDTYGKENTVKSLPGTIEYFINNGYKFKTII